MTAESRSTVSPGQRLIRVAALAAIIGGLAVLAGWAFDIGFLKSLSAGWVSMKPNTAVCFILIGIALLSQDRPHLGQSSADLPRLSRYAGPISAGIVGIVALVTLAQYLFEWDVGIDQWLFKEPLGTVGTSHPGRMAPETALCFLFLAAAQLVASVAPKSRWTAACSASSGLLVMILSLAAVVSYLTPVLGTFGWFGFTNMALHTAVLCALLGAALALETWQREVVSWALGVAATSAFACGMALLVMIGFTASRTEFRLADSQRRIVLADALLSCVESVRSETALAHVATHRYVISGDERSREAQALAAKRVKELIATLLRLDADLDELFPHHHSSPLAELVNDEMGWERQLIDSRGSGLSDAARDAMLRRGDELIEAVRSAADKFQSGHRKTIEQLVDRVEVESRPRYLVIAIGTLVSLMTFLAALFRLNFAQKERERVDSELRVKDWALESAIDGIAICDLQGNLSYVNPAFLRLWGYDSPEEVIGKSAVTFCQISDGATAVKDALQNAGRWVGELTVHSRTGEAFAVQVGASIVSDAAGRPVCTLASFADITARKQAEQSRLRLNRLYGLLSEANQTILRCRTAHEVFEQISQVAVEQGDFAFVWVGLLESDGVSLRCVSEAGNRPDQMASLLHIAEEAIRSGRPWVCSETIAPSAGRPQDSGGSIEAACATFPIRRGGAAIGAIQFQSVEPCYFTQDVLETLREMTVDIAYALDQFELQTQNSAALEALRKSEERFRHISSTISDIAYSCSQADGRLTIDWITGATERITGYTAEEIKALGDWRSLIHDDDREQFEQAVIGLAVGASGNCELRLRHKSGKLLWVASFAECVPDQNDPASTRLYGALIDVTARREADERLSLAAAVLESTRDGVLVTDLDGRIIAVNRAYSEITGYAEPEILGQNPRVLQSGRHGPAFYRSLWEGLLTSGHWQGEIWNRRKNGEEYAEWMSVSTVRDAANNPTHYVAVFTDISQLKQTEIRLEHLAHYDPLTDLPNRTLVNLRLEHALQQAQRGKHHVGVLFIDLDRFKNINDSLGHPVGDMILREVGRRLQERVRESDTIGRLGGDEFLVVLEGLARPDDSATVAAALLNTLETPFVLPEGREAYIRASVGISLYPQDGRTPEELIRNADTAMYQVKESGRNAYAYYTRALTAAANERLDMETRLRRAMEREEFVIHYQPLVSVSNGRLLGAEALVRWQPPGEDLIAPARFIPLAEDTGLIVKLGEWVLRRACAQAKAWQDAGLSFEQVAINLSVRQFQHPELERIVRSVLAETGLSPDCLELEITESSLLGTGPQTVANLQGIKALGLRLSIDDFGTGYSSLAYLKRLPLDRLKIDYSFIRDIPDDANDAAIATTIIAMAHTLGLQALAEGVENEAQLEFLRREGCDAYQGYLFSAPLSADEFAARFLMAR